MEPLLLVFILLMLALSAFFSSSEIAFVVANRLRVEVLARRSGVFGRTVSGFVKNPATFLTTTLVGNNLALVTYSTLVALTLNTPLETFFAWAGMTAGINAAVLITQTLVASFVVLIFGEILPKSIAREVADRAVFVFALPLRATYFLLLPFIKLAGGAASVLIRLFNADADTITQFLRRDFELIIRESREGDLRAERDESELLSNVLALANIRVKESMVPRTGIIAVDEQTTVEVARQRFIETGHSKLPVYRDNIDNIVGMVFAYDLFQGPATIQEIIRPAKFVPEAKRSKDLLREFLSTNTSIAVVIDEYGGTAGLVTREDLLEELFGDIQDEFDTDTDVMRQTGDNSYVVSGRVAVDELRERFGVDLTEGDYETIAGYLLEQLGTIPASKEEFELDGFRFLIIKATNNRIDLIRIVRVGSEDPDEASGR
jgi:putative hemolysin